MKIVNVILSEQDLSEFLEGDEGYMEAYRAELARRLTEHFDDVNVEIDSNYLVDSIDIDGEQDERGFVNQIMNDMVSDWDWLPEY